MGVVKNILSQPLSAKRKHRPGYGMEEVIEFCVDFILDLDPIAVLKSRHGGRLSGKRTLEKKTYIGTKSEYFNKAHYIVL